MWEVEYTDEFGAWFSRLAADEQEAIAGAVRMLEERGPGLGRPYVDTIKTSRHAHLKELRPPIGHVRVLFAFDPRRTAILLIGGDKRHRWSEWYRTVVPIADRLYDQHLAMLKAEGLMP